MTESRRFTRAWDALGRIELTLGEVVIGAPDPDAPVGARVVVGRRRDGVRFELDPGDGAVWSVAPSGAATRAYDDLDDLIRTYYRADADRSGLREALAGVDRHDAYFAPGARDTARAAAAAEVAAGRIGFAPVDDVPGAAVDAARSPDGRWRLETTVVRTRKIDVATGASSVVLEGWLQVAALWLPGDRPCVLCTEGAADLDLADPEIGSLRTLRDAFPGPDRVVRVQSSGLLHVLDAAGAYLYHVRVDADRLAGDPARGLVVLTRARGGDPRRPPWRTAILLATPAGLVVLAKHPADIGRLVAAGGRLFGAHGFELVGVDAAIAAAGAWRTVAIEDGLALEPPPRRRPRRSRRRRRRS